MFKIIQDSIILYKIVNLRYLLEIRRSYKPLFQNHLKHDVHVHAYIVIHAPVPAN